MKVPKRPPSTPLTAELLMSILGKGGFRAEQDGRYLHWDELRHRKPPEGVALEQWWAGIKLARLGGVHTLPFTGTDGRPFSFVVTDTGQRLVHEIDRDASGRIELPEDIANRETRDRYVVSSLIEESIRSSQIEGASTTHVIAKEMLRTKRAPRDKSERMILNNYLAMDWVRAHRDEALTVAMICELQRIVTDATLHDPDAAGRFRRADERIQVIDESNGEILHTPPAAATLAARMDQLCAFANGGTRAGEPFIHPVIRAIVVHFWLAYDHPFVDGNGRTARALFYWSMLRQGYWLTEFLSISRVIHKARAKYDRAFLYTETDDNDATYFVLHQLGVVRDAIDELHAYLRRKAQEMRDTRAQLKKHKDLNERQIAALGYAQKHPDAELTVEGHQHSHRIVYDTARLDLLGLVKAKLFTSRKSGKKLVFSLKR